MKERKKRSSKDQRGIPPYVAREKERQILMNDKTPWTTSQIVRENPKDQTSKIVEIKIITR